jgi:hypothetical protein
VIRQTNPSAAEPSPGRSGRSGGLPVARTSVLHPGGHAIPSAVHSSHFLMSGVDRSATSAAMPPGQGRGRNPPQFARGHGDTA